MTDFDQLIEDLTFDVRDLYTMEVGSDDVSRLPPAFVIGRQGVHFGLFPFVDDGRLKLHVYGFDSYGVQRLNLVLEVPE